jgi:hypothetical protein
MESHAWSLIEVPLGQGKVYCIDTDGSHDGPMVSTDRSVVQHLVDAHNASVAQVSAEASDWKELSRNSIRALQQGEGSHRVHELTETFWRLNKWNFTEGERNV